MNKLKKLVPQSLKNIYHLGQAILANLWYGFPSRKIKVIGVTGTNGKTTTCQLITKILEEAGHKVALASTINFKIGEEEWVNKTKFTTLSAFATQRMIHRAAYNKCSYLVLETSSHSLDQNRVWGVSFDVGIITNVTREHLDYHKTIEKYRRAKMKLFRQAKTAIVNLDMENPAEFLDLGNEKRIGYTRYPEIEIDTKNIEVIKAEDIDLQLDGTSFTVLGQKFSLHLPGEFNLENALAAIGVTKAQEIKMDVAAVALNSIQGVPGRLEFVSNSKNLNIIIDYAVTPDSLKKLYIYLNKLKMADSKIIAVFGSCGERDRGKRPMMGEIVSDYADCVIVTNEDPYYEDPQQIIEEVASGVKNKTENENFWKIFDRREAIARALSLAKQNDIVVVTGKGAEETMAVGNKRIPWNDKQVILEELQKI